MIGLRVLSTVTAKNNINNPVFSIIMNCRNGSKYLVESINSIKALKEINWELIFFDNKSTDDSLKIVKQFAKKDDRIKIFQSLENLTLGKARQMAIEQARGIYVSFLDVDDLYNPSFFKNVESIFGEKNVICTYANSEFFQDNKTLRIAHNKKMPSGNLRFRLLYRYFIPLETVVFSLELLKKNQIKFDPNLNHCSDWALTLEAAIHGKFLYRTNKAVAKWRIHENNESIISDWKFFVEKIDFIDKFGGLKLKFNFLFCFILKLLINLHFIVYYLKRKTFFKVCKINDVKEKIFIAYLIMKVNKFVQM